MAIIGLFIASGSLTSLAEEASSVSSDSSSGIIVVFAGFEAPGVDPAAESPVALTPGLVLLVAGLVALVGLAVFLSFLAGVELLAFTSGLVALVLGSVLSATPVLF